MATGDGVTRNFVDASSTARFDDVCCRREASSRAGVYFCDLSPDEPGVVDAIYEETNADNIIAGLFDHMRTLDSITPDSPFLAEAVESKEKCVAYCEMKAECQSCMHFTPRSVWPSPILLIWSRPRNHADNLTCRPEPRRFPGLPLGRARRARGSSRRRPWSSSFRKYGYEPFESRSARIRCAAPCGSHRDSRASAT